MTVVYGYNTLEKRKELWQQLAGISHKVSKPWIIWGDFNSILCPKDRLYGTAVTNMEIKDFAECVRNLMLNELPWKGDYYTWTNKQQGGDRIWSRIDRAMGNADWMMQFGHLTTKYKLPHISDHSPMMINTNLREPKIKPPFKLFNVWSTHENFPKIVEDCWTQNLHVDTMRNIWLKQKDLRGKLKILNETEFKGIAMKIEQAREDLKEVQTKISAHYTDALASEEKNILCQLESGP
ncbi:uncharacterized protein [Nicotiana tomentosiformis]|uniref:uncharacterized protein n=1 Tax=Nicotiana tomentosiformis TaxID=4098 RepID=UPI00388CAF17